MKKIKQLIIFSMTLIVMSGCDKDFEEINTNPYQIEAIDPSLLFADQQRTHTGGWESEYTIVQQFVNPFNSGATEAFNFNADIDNFNNGKWGIFTGLNKNYLHGLTILEDQPERVNLRSMMRIWRANAFMGLVDTYANVPFSEAGRALEGKDFWYPSYDDDAAIYAAIETELREAIGDLDPTADYVSSDLFYGENGPIATSTDNAADQVDKWNKLGNSILLRLGMRYSKVDPAKADALVSEAFNGGVMTSNADNAYVEFDGTFDTNGTHNGLINNNPYFYYAAEPFVDQLRNTLDPRGQYLVATFANPGNPLADPAPNTDISSQFGVPVGVISTDLENAPYRGPKGAGFDYAQMNVNSIASILAPDFWVTYGEVSLLLAEAAARGWVPGGDAQAQTYYENGIRADMDRYALLPNADAPSATDFTNYLADASVDFTAATTLEERLERINTQLWIAYITNGTQGWANFRRSGYPALNPNGFNNLLQQGTNADGFVHRMSYPDYELAENPESYQAAVQAIGGTDDLVSRVFWDIP